jgi:DnaJ like chaperone protein
MMARGVPGEAARLAEKRLAAINTAWDAIRAERGAA